MRHRELKRRDVMSEGSYNACVYMANNDINVLSVTATSIDSWVAVIEYALLRPADKKKIWPKTVVEVRKNELMKDPDTHEPVLVSYAIMKKAMEAVAYIRGSIETAADEQAALKLLSSALKGR